MIIIEGMDGSGKTTLAKKLAKELQISYIHYGPPPKNEKEFRERCIRSSILFNKPVIQDRTPFISELIYAQLKNRDPFLSLETSQNAIRLNNPILVYCRPRYFLQRTEKYDSHIYIDSIKQNWWNLQTNYDSYMAQMRAIRYDYANTKNASITYKRILDLYEEKLKLTDF